MDYIYLRYSNFWILFVNIQKNQFKKCQKLFEKLEISSTHLIDFTEKKVTFFAFTFINNTFKILKKKIKDKKHFQNKWESNKLKIGINHYWAVNKLIFVGILTKDFKIKPKNYHKILSLPKIIKVYNYELQSFFNYYYVSVTDKNILNTYYYYYKLSFLKTLYAKIKYKKFKCPKKATWKIKTKEELKNYYYWIVKHDFM